MWRKFRISNRKNKPKKLANISQEHTEPLQQEQPSDNIQTTSESQPEPLPGATRHGYAEDVQQPEETTAGDVAHGHYQEEFEGVYHEESSPPLEERQVSENFEGEAFLDEAHSPAAQEGDGSDILETEQEVIDEDALRANAYVKFTSVDPGDFTAGPARLVVAEDGVKPCVALLLTMELAECVHRAIQKQRTYAQADLQALKEEAAAFRFEWRLTDSIQNHKFRIEELEDSEDPNDIAEKLMLEAEQDKLELLLKNTKAKQQVIQARLRTEANNLHTALANMTSYLEDAFLAGNLVEPAGELLEVVVPELNVNEEYKRICQAEQEYDGMEPASPPASLHSCEDDIKPLPLSPEQQVKADLCEAYHLAKQCVKYAEDAFDRRERDRALEREANAVAFENGVEGQDATPEEFDVRWCLRIQHLTRELIEAEEDLAQAKIELVKEGISLQEDDQGSGFVDDVDDGYRMSCEAEMVATVLKEGVVDWMQSIPSPALTASFPPNPEDVDVEVWNCIPVRMKDSASVVAGEPDRHRIDRWRRMCGLSDDVVEDELCEEDV